MLLIGCCRALGAGAPSQTIVLDFNYDPVLGGGPMQGQTLYFSIADEGNGSTGNAEPGEPKITNVDILTGTVWASNNTGPFYQQINDQLWSADVTTATGSVNATGKAFSISINRNGAAGFVRWGLRVFIGVPGLDGPYDPNWSNGNSFGASFGTQDDADGWQGVTGRPDGAIMFTPEPSTLVLASLAFLDLTAAAWRSRRKV